MLAAVPAAGRLVMATSAQPAATRESAQAAAGRIAAM